MRHGRDCPSRCSICLGAPVRRIESVGPDVTIDGEPAGRKLEIKPLSRSTIQAQKRRARAN